MSEAKIEETDCKDRIRALPEELLVTILLHVPIKDAVATMILSKRWRYIWMMMPTLDYNETNNVNHARDWGGDDDDDSDDDLESKSIWWFLDKSLKLHKAPVLEILLISLGQRCPIDANVGNWVAKAVDRGVIVLQFKLRWSAGPTTLPKSLYTCETLKELTLSNKILVDFPSSPSCLPSLEILQLSCVVYKDEDSFARFLSSCPVLGKLIVNRKKNDNLTNFIVKVPSLWMLWYYNITWLLDDYDVVDSGSFLVIDTPALIKFDVTDYSRHSWSIGNMPCLEEAYIMVDCLSLFDKIITASSVVLSLVLTFSDEMLVRCSTVRFSLLIKLSVDPSGSNWVEPLLLLLGNTPKLEELLVNNESASVYEDIPLSWNQPSSIPGCLSSHLKIFEWRYYGHKEEEEEFLTYILANSKCLKTATISLKSMYPELEQDFIIGKLKDIPRVSTTSRLLVN
ncbi:putative FBD-associated F-box protein At1g05080 [Raphanus sativus]|uniref:FBD-associated F-box protein At1g05080 n=1 Tax=Raphanus sativus TaxID=3726 RepID=A0A9W3C9U6_RAPSA|nr:putative FBD-associated F-box protein At1g05080 [Raphanus sativus]